MNLLDSSNPLITIREADGSIARTSLPGVLERLASGADVDFPHLRSHQENAWYCLTVQLAAAVIFRRAGRTRPTSELDWTEELSNLAGAAGRAAWDLENQDPASPAFMQPPLPHVPGLAEWGTVVASPDALDVVPTTRNHEAKIGSIQAPLPEHWLYALVALQTLEGYTGRANYGIARMNGGYGSRPLVGAAPTLGLGSRFQRDLELLGQAIDKLVDLHGFDHNGPLLLWTLPWDGKSSRPLHGLHPFFVEVCRHVRLVVARDRLVCRIAGTDAPRLEAKELKGHTGDPWTPVENRGDELVALSVGPRGFDYKKLTEILLRPGDWNTPALELRPTDGEEPILVARVLARGQGGTSGFHERTLPLSRRARRLFAERAERERLGSIAQQRIDVVDTVKKKVLSPCLCSLLQGGKEDLELSDDRRLGNLDQFDKGIDDIFFDALFADLELATDDEADLVWRRRLFERVEAAVRRAEKTLPIPAATRERAIARSDLILSGARSKVFRLDTPPRQEDSP